MAKLRPSLSGKGRFDPWLDCEHPARRPTGAWRVRTDRAGWDAQRTYQCEHCGAWQLRFIFKSKFAVPAIEPEALTDGLDYAAVLMRRGA